MIYEYHCSKCKDEFDVVKPVADIDRQELCPVCQTKAKRAFVPKHLFLNKTQVTHPEWNPGLGVVVKNERHKRYLMESRNLQEIGNDYGSGEKMQAKFEKDREEKRAKRWEDD